MLSSEDEQSFDLEQMEKWLENYFLDPVTTFEDQTKFRIDLYETNQEWIVEALLTEYESSEIAIMVVSQKLVIAAGKKDFPPAMDNCFKTRSIDFPFYLSQKQISASFQNGILEILISKLNLETERDSLIPIS